jgi:soluble lytic murein transglycosylase-like protein
MNENQVTRLLLAVVVTLCASAGVAAYAQGAVPPPRIEQPASCWHHVRAELRADAHHGKNRAAWWAAADAAGRYFGLPRAILPAIVDREQCGPGPYPRGCTWNPSALSPKGARGLGQVMPATVAMKRGIVPAKATLDAIDITLHDPAANLCWSARIASDALRLCGGGTLRSPHDHPEDIPCMLAGYNAGEGVSDYVADILTRWRG